MTTSSSPIPPAMRPAFRYSRPSWALTLTDSARSKASGRAPNFSEFASGRADCLGERPGDLGARGGDRTADPGRRDDLPVQRHGRQRAGVRGRVGRPGGVPVGLEGHVDDPAGALRALPGGGRVDLGAGDQRLVEQVDRGAVDVAGDQRLVRIVQPAVRLEVGAAQASAARRWPRSPRWSRWFRRHSAGWVGLAGSLPAGQAGAAVVARCRSRWHPCRSLAAAGAVAAAVSAAAGGCRGRCRRPGWLRGGAYRRPGSGRGRHARSRRAQAGR